MQRKFGDLLRERRKASGKTMLEVSEFLGISVPYLSDVERGQRSPFAVERIQMLADFLGADARALVDAAAASRGHVVLDVSAEDPAEKAALATSLARAWPALTDDVLRRIRKIIDEPPGGGQE